MQLEDEQDGRLKKRRAQKLRKLKQGSLVLQMKKTYFSRPQGDEYNFYHGSLASPNRL